MLESGLDFLSKLLHNFWAFEEVEERALFTHIMLAHIVSSFPDYTYQTAPMQWSHYRP